MQKESVKKLISIFLGMTTFVIFDLFVMLLNPFNISLKYSLKFVVPFSLIIFSLIFAISKKSSTSLKICYIIIFLVSIINQIKIKITNEPLYLSDIQFLRKITRLLNLVVTNISWKIIFKFIIVFSFFGLILFGFSIIGNKNNITLENKKIRILIIAVDIIFLLVLFIPTKFTQSLFLDIFLDNKQFVDYDGYGTNLHYYFKYGFTTGIYGVHLNSYFFEPENYNENLLNSELSKYEQDDKSSNGELGKPNIIVILSESFWDVDQLNEVKFNQKITPNFNELKKQGYFVNLISPTYGGMSENVAFELLTGGSMNYFSQGYIPITSLYNRNNSSEIPSLVKVLKDSGYKTKTTFVEDYYDTEKAYKKMGFETYNELYSQNPNTEYNDENLTDEIINDLKKVKDSKIFNVYSTYENHMPFYKEKYDEYCVDIEKSELSNADNDALRAYAQGIYNSDKQLGRLYDYIQEIEEPTIVLFFGDHLPFIINSNYENVISKLKYFNTSDQKLNLFRCYNTQALVLSNYDMGNFEMPEYLGVDLLLNKIVNSMEIEVPNYYKWLNNTETSLTASNKYISLNFNGDIYLTKDLKGKMKEMYELKEQMQYKLFIK